MRYITRTYERVLRTVFIFVGEELLEITAHAM